MSILIKQIIGLLPFFILIFNIFLIFISIILYRKHIIVFLATLLSLNSILIILFYLNKIIPINFSTLIYINFYSLIYILMIILSSIFIVILSYFYLKNHFLYQEEFYILLLSSIFGSILVVLSSNMITLFIGVELMSLPVIGLMVYSIFYQKVIKIMLKYMILSMISSILMVFGISIIYSICGNLNFNTIKIYFLINNIKNNQILLLGISFILISLFFKLSIFPLHFWVPDIYQNTYSILLLYMTTVMKIAIFSVLINLFMYFPYLQAKILYYIIEIMSICSIIFGSIMILFQKNIKKFFGYSSIIHMGYMIFILLIIKQYHLAHQISIIYLINYIISNIGIFSLLILFEFCDNIHNNKIYNLSYYKGLFWKYPILTIAITVIIFSFLGIPLTFGFITKFLIIFLSVKYNLWLINLAILINSILGIYYYLNIITKLYYAKDIKNGVLLVFPYNIIIKLIVLISIINIFFGFFPNILMKILNIYL